MIYIKYSSPDVSLNLAAEYYFASEKTFDEDLFTLWQPRPTVVVGNFQNIHEEVDTAYAASRGIDIVRRMSGGGTVYQDGGSIQYAFIERRDGDIDFARYLTPICRVLKSLGIDAVPNGRNDITVDGKKVSGNSQYRVSGRTIHHGTLLFSVDVDEMERATRLPDYKAKSKGIKSVRSRVANLSDYTTAVKILRNSWNTWRKICVLDRYTYRRRRILVALKRSQTSVSAPSAEATCRCARPSLI